MQWDCRIYTQSWNFCTNRGKQLFILLWALYFCVCFWNWEPLLRVRLIHGLVNSVMLSDEKKRYHVAVCVNQVGKNMTIIICIITYLKGLYHQFRSSWKYCHSKATNIDIWRLIFKKILTCSLILYSSLKFICLGSKLIQIINLFWICLEDAVCAFKILESNSTWILLVNTRRGETYWLIPSLVHFFIALATSLRRQVLLYGHSKCLGNCSMRIQNIAGAALYDHTTA
jgi:hypothetical protein